VRGKTWNFPQRLCGIPCEILHGITMEHNVFHGNSMEYFTCNTTESPMNISRFSPRNSIGYKTGTAILQDHPYCYNTQFLFNWSSFRKLFQLWMCPPPAPNNLWSMYLQVRDLPVTGTQATVSKHWKQLPELTSIKETCTVVLFLIQQLLSYTEKTPHPHAFSYHIVSDHVYTGLPTFAKH